jgi:hypothetical protein
LTTSGRADDLSALDTRTLCVVPDLLVEEIHIHSPQYVFGQ